MPWTTTDLLADVRRRGMLPTTATQGTLDADILEHANNELFTNLVPLIMSANEEYFVITTDVSMVSGQYAYRIPNRAVGGKLRDCNYIMGAAMLNLARIEPEQLTQFVIGAAGMPAGFYLEAGTVNLVPRPTAPGVMRLKYFARPGRLSNTVSDYRQITGVTYTGSNTVALTTTAGISLSGATTMDVIAFRPPFEYLLCGASIVTDGSLTGNWALSVSSPTNPPPDFSPNIQVGDYLCVADRSPVMQIPIELHSLLVQRTVCAIMEAYNYQDRLQAAKAIANEMEARALKLMQPRVDGAPKKMRGILNTHTRFGPGLR